MSDDERYIAGEVAERERCRDIASILVSHLLESDHPQAEVWADALAWFRKRIKGGHLSIYAQQDFDQKFGAVDWSAGPVSEGDQSGEAS